MPALLALFDFLAGTYTVGSTSYTLNEVVSNRVTSGGPCTVDADGLVINATNVPQAIGPFLSEWAGLYNASGFTCIESYSIDAGQYSGNNWINAIDATGGPGIVNIIFNASDYTPYYTLVTEEGYTVVQSPNPCPVSGIREINAWQLGLVSTAICTNGGRYYVEGPSQVWGPLANGITFGYGSSPMHLQWLGLYDQTVEISWLPELSTGYPPTTIPTGPGTGLPLPKVGVVTGGGIIRIRG